MVCFFFQAEDGIRDGHVTGVQTCALPISLIKDTIQKVVGEEVTIVSSSEETARETSTILDVHGLLYQGEREDKHAFYTTGDLEMFTAIANGIFNQEVGHVPVVDCEKIGRASCRERAEHSGVVGGVK